MKDFPFKFWIILLFIVSFLFIVLIVFFNYKVDPFQFYHKSNKAGFSSNDRFQNAGLIRSYDYDTVVIGSSITKFLTPDRLKRKLNVKAIRLKINGTSPSEQNIILNTVLEHKKIKLVIMSIDDFGLKKKGKLSPKFPLYLYDKKITNDLKYLISSNTFILSCGIEFLGYKFKEETPYRYGKEFVCKHEKTRFKKVNKEKNQNKKNLKSKLKQKKNEKNLKEIKEVMRTNLEKYYLANAKAHPEIEFYFFFPPYASQSYLDYKQEKLEDYISEWFNIKRYLLKRIKELNLKNVKVFDFQDYFELTDQVLIHYKDFVHYSPFIAEQMLDKIAKNKMLLTESNIEQRINNFTKHINNLKDKDPCNLKDFYSKIENK